MKKNIYLVGSMLLALTVVLSAPCEVTNPADEASEAQWIAFNSFQSLLKQVGLEKTISEYELLASMYPDDAWICFYLGHAYLMRYQKTDALEQWNSNRKEVSGIYREYLTLPDSECLNNPVDLGSKTYLKKAVQAWERCVELDPDLVAAYCLLGNAAFQFFEYDKAVAYYDETYKRTIDPVIAGFLAAAYRKNGELDKARRLCEDLLAGPAASSSELYSQLSLVCMEQENFDKAINYGKKAIELRPGNIDAYISLAKIYREAGFFEESNKVCGEGLELNPFVPVLYSSRGINYERLEQYDEALANHRKVLELDPYYYKAYNNIGVILDLKGLTEDAIKSYRKASQHLDDDYVYVNLIQALQKFHRNEEAFEVADAYLKRFPDHSAVSRLAGISLYSLGEFEKAKPYLLASDLDVSFYLAGVALEGKDYPAAESLSKKALANCRTPVERAYTLDILSKACLNQNRLDDALKYSIEGERVAEDKVLEYEAFCRIGQILALQRKMEDAIAAWNQAIALDPDSAAAYLDAAGWSLNAGNEQAAFDYCKKLLDINPDSANGLEIMGRIFRYRQPKDAVNLLIRSWELAPDRSDPLALLCEILIFDQREVVTAEPHLKKLETQFPDIWKAYSLRGLSLAFQNQHTAAIPYFEKAAKLEPTGHIYNLLGYTHFLLKNYTLAEEAYIKGLGYSDSRGIIYFNLALLHEATGECQDALNCLNLSVENGYADNPDFRNRLLGKLIPSIR